MHPATGQSSPIETGGTSEVSRSRVLAIYVLPTLVLLAFVVWPLVSGAHTLFFRDVFNTHLEMKWWQAEAMREGFVPLVDPYRSGGQAHLGNPNTVALYPDNLLYLVAPLFWAFNAHFWIHLLLAPAGVYWLGRQLGLDRGAAWAAGVFYAAGGYVLSTLNLYNLVAGAALVPAFMAAILGLCSKPGRRWGLGAAAGIWCLLILAGDPMTAALGLAMGASVLWIGRPGRSARVKLALAVVFGTVMAAPQWVEFLRIVGLSFRGHQGYSVSGATAASWHPAAVLEWFIPFAYGMPDLTFWGQRFYSSAQPLFYSFYPGVLALACLGVGISLRSARSRTLTWALALIGLGVFLALGGHNPVVAWLLGLPGLGVLRLPVKFWPLVALPAALVSGIGFGRCAARGGAVVFRRAAAVLLCAFVAAWLLVTLAGPGIEGLMTGWMPAGFAASGLAGAERARWAESLLQSAGVLMLFVLSTVVRERLFRSLLPVLLVVHLMLQLALLAPLYRSEETVLYAAPPPPTNAVPQDAIAAHGAAGDLFGRVPVPVDRYPSPDPRWMQRQLHNEAHPYVGMMARRRFEFALSPEGLDTFLTRAATEAFRSLRDPERIRLLEASGVEWLYMKRELEDPEASKRVELVARYPSLGSDLLLYRLRGAAPPVGFVGEVLGSGSLNEALTIETSPGFDARDQVVVAGPGGFGSGLGGTVTVEDGSARAESWTWRVSAQGSGALVIQRAHLPIYRLEVDGREVRPLVANLHRMAVPLEAGSHSVTLTVDRRLFRMAVALALLTAVTLLLYVLSGPAQRFWT